ncbi:MAG: c-type cytochrome domain-containing protein [Planctomycetia bacterium]
MTDRMSELVRRLAGAGSTPATGVRSRRLVAVLVAAVVAVGIGAGSAVVVSAAEPFEAFLDQHCVRCHGGQEEQGELRLDRLSRDFRSSADTHHWAEVVERVNSGEMPPAKEPRPTQAEIAAFVTNLDGLLKQGRAARMAARPPVAVYRLSRRD